MNESNTKPVSENSGEKPLPQLKPMLSNMERAILVIIISAVAAIVLFFALLTIMKFLGILTNYIHGMDNLQQVRDAGDGMKTILSIYNLLDLLMILFFILWFYRAYSNLEKCGRPGLTQFGSGWAIGAWFVPFLNCVRPVRMAYEIGAGMQKVALVRKEEDLQLVQPLPVIGAWWGFFLAHHVISLISYELMREVKSIELLQAGLFLGCIGVVLGIIALVFSCLMVRKISGFETKAMQCHNEEVANQDNLFVDAKAVTPAINGPNAPTANDPFA